MESFPEHHVPTLFYVLAGLAVFYFCYNLRRLFAVRIGRPESRRLRFWEVVRNAVYYGVAQRRVTSLRFGYGAVMHFCLGWGFIELFFATTVDFFVTRGWFVSWLPGKDTPWFAVLNDLGGLLLIVGTGMALVRRHSNLKPEYLPQDAFRGRGNLFGDTGLLLILLLLGLGGFFAESARLAVEQPVTAWFSFVAYPLSYIMSAAGWEKLEPWLWWSHAGLALVFIALIPQTKMFHSLVGIVNVALTNDSERGQLRAMNIGELLETPDTSPEEMVLGAGKVGDLTWKQLLDAVACTECGRCTAVCPAYATGKLLSPMKIIQNVRHDLYAETIGDRESRPLINGLIDPEELWSCTTCAACIAVCPVFIDHVPTIVDMRRYLVLSEGKPPEDGAPSLERALQHGNPWGFPREERLKWAEDAGLELPLISDRGETDVLYWVGCAGAYDPRNQEIARAMVTILQAAQVDFAVLGKAESCTGDSARRMGEEYVYETLARQNIETLSRYRFNRILTTCPHCYQTLGRDYRQFGTRFNVIHHSQLLEELLANGRLKIAGSMAERVTYHDPCYLGRYNHVYDTPRRVLAGMLGTGGELVEMREARDRSFCCGAGGGNMWYDIERGRRINLERFDQAAQTGAGIIATACSFCAIMLDDALKVRGREDTIQIKDLAELIRDNLD